MIYVCCSCHKMFDQVEFENVTIRKEPDYFVPFGAIGWYHSTYICPNPKCHYENAGYDLKTEEEFIGIKSYMVHWHDGNMAMLRGFDIKNAIVRAGFDISELLNIKKFREVSA